MSELSKRLFAYVIILAIIFVLFIVALYVQYDIIGK